MDFNWVGCAAFPNVSLPFSRAARSSKRRLAPNSSSPSFSMLLAALCIRCNFLASPMPRCSAACTRFLAASAASTCVDCIAGPMLAAEVVFKPTEICVLEATAATRFDLFVFAASTNVVCDDATRLIEVVAVRDGDAMSDVLIGSSAVGVLSFRCGSSAGRVHSPIEAILLAAVCGPLDLFDEVGRSDNASGTVSAGIRAEVFRGSRVRAAVDLAKRDEKTCARKVAKARTSSRSFTCFLCLGTARVLGRFSITISLGFFDMATASSFAQITLMDLTEASLGSTTIGSTTEVVVDSSTTSAAGVGATLDAFFSRKPQPHSKPAGSSGNDARGTKPCEALVPSTPSYVQLSLVMRFSRHEKHGTSWSACMSTSTASDSNQFLVIVQ